MHLSSSTTRRTTAGLEVRVGVDVCAVADIAESIETFGDRYLGRVFTPAELAYCAGRHAHATEKLAARFAAKEAVLKVLRPREARPQWTSIEVCRDPSGACDISLAGTAARLADSEDIVALSVSLSHEKTYAVAVVAATICRSSEVRHDAS